MVLGPVVRPLYFFRRRFLPIVSFYRCVRMESRGLRFEESIWPHLLLVFDIGKHDKTFDLPTRIDRQSAKRARD